eukprot:jgi/Tetstr1/456836/TSEL_043510.t1
MGKKGGGRKQAPNVAATGNDSEDGLTQQETVSQLRARHVKEMKEHRKEMDKLGKKQKDEVDRRTKDISERHAEELAALKLAKAEQDRDSDDGDAGGGDATSKDDSGCEQVVDVASLMAGASLYGSAEPNDRKPSKSQKRKQAKKLQDAEREARIASEKEQLGPTDRSLEEAALHELLRPQSLHIKEIPADGNCLYRALEDQLKLTSSCTPAAASHGHQDLRKMAASYMRTHPDDYMPFVIEDCDDPSAEFEKYCSDVEDTATWGGQVEIDALAHVLERHIAVYSTDLDEVGGFALTYGNAQSEGSAFPRMLAVAGAALDIEMDTPHTDKANTDEDDNGPAPHGNVGARHPNRAGNEKRDRDQALRRLSMDDRARAGETGAARWRRARRHGCSRCAPAVHGPSRVAPAAKP